MVDRVATYRIQLTPRFGFADAGAVVPDLARLGVSHLYLSPVADAITGSTHGYDVVRPDVVRAALGGREALWMLATTARGHGMGLVIDLVPNHVSSAEPQRNPWWWDLLARGREADTADYFDVDWEAGDGRVVVPVLGHDLDETIRDGELRLDPTGTTVRYHDQRYPTLDAAPGSDLVALLDRQHYRLTKWSAPERNVRRFFDVDTLVAVRPEVPAVTDALHRTVRQLAADDLLDGVRLDHIDGLADPTTYLAELRAELGDGNWILVEKILVGDEQLLAEWPVDGTTGYEWITQVDHLFTHPDGEPAITTQWQAMTGDDLDFHAHETAGIRDTLSTSLRSDLDRVIRVAVAESAASADPLDAQDLVAPLIELTVHLGRYRTYLGSATAAASADDLEVLHRAAAAAALGLGGGSAEVLRRLVALLEEGGEATRRWQQLTGAALAKGGEDQALYRSLRLSAHNEVGGDPGRWTTSVEEFHAHNLRTVDDRPSTLLAGSTHDTKRSEDVRARLLAVTEIPTRWAAQVAEWSADLEARDLAPGGWAVTLAIQTAVGVWPIDATRLGDYLVKAAREAALTTTWTAPDADFESALRALAADLTEGPLAESVHNFVESIEPAAQAISLVQLALRVMAPGVPDLYQGSESWLRVLVDPDNRRPLDPQRLTATVEGALAADDVWAAPDPKSALLARLLRLRRRHLHAFGPGSRYVPLATSGDHSDHVVAFGRGTNDGTAVLVVASRFAQSRPRGWQQTSVTLPAGGWVDVLTRRHIDVPPGVDGAGSVPVIDLFGDGETARPAATLERVTD